MSSKADLSGMSRAELEQEITELELRLQDARSRLQHADEPYSVSNPSTGVFRTNHSEESNEGTQIPSFLHPLMLICDSALPLGSFAYSSGLESFIAHHKDSSTQNTQSASFHRFLRLSIASVSSTSIPYLLEAYRSPAELQSLDNDLDASTPCTVARRASIAQGRALLNVWEKSFRMTYSRRSQGNDAPSASAVTAIEDFSEALKSGGFDNDCLGPNGHFAPLWGAFCAAVGIDINLAAYTFMLNHAKAVLSAAVRASVLGPYQAQSILASDELRDSLKSRIQHDYHTKIEDAGQVAPILDLWVGRHELLYSRIFNS